MAVKYSVELCKKLEREFGDIGLHRAMRVGRYDAGDELEYSVKGVWPVNEGVVKLSIERFVGGGFAGQVYKVKVVGLESDDGGIAGLEVGGEYAMKILIPPAGGSLFFRNFVYWVGFQGPFQLQVNPLAARAGALWQKFIRRAAGIKFGDQRSVVDIYATFVDRELGSCGELSEWVEGRNWRFEVDDRMGDLDGWCRGEEVEDYAGSVEYRSKRIFMQEFVELLHEVGAPEFARQYEWYTCKSQPNCLKRLDREDSSEAGLTAVDFRAGLALLPFLPMSPGDFGLIGKGLKRGSLVQFDRGSLKKLGGYVEEHGEDFGDMAGAIEELRGCEEVYRNSLPDVTHNHVRLLYSGKLWRTILSSAVTGWGVRGIADEGGCEKIGRSRFKAVIFWLIGVVPILGSFLRRIWARADYRRHYGAMFGRTGGDYILKALRGRAYEGVIRWHRQGLVSEAKAQRFVRRPWKYYLCWPLSILPVGLFKLLTDFTAFKQFVGYFLVRPVKLYFSSELREQWLMDMVAEGRARHMLTDEDAERILSRIKEPFIQKYLKSLAVHICTLPVTQVVSVAIAGIYYFTHPEDPNAWAVGLGIIAVFQVIPMSPGSICRGLYTLSLVIRERNFKDYNIAVFLSFFKYVGYLAFPIQMAYRYPTLARFMAAHWATGAVHIVPVFGESGALLEYSMFRWFYNWPLTIRRRMEAWAEMRKAEAERAWHVLPLTAAGVLIFGATDVFRLSWYERLPGFNEIWYLAIGVPLLVGMLFTMFAGGMRLSRRIGLSAGAGVFVGGLYALVHVLLGDGTMGAWGVFVCFLWRVFICGIFGAIGAILRELRLGEVEKGAFESNF